MRRIALALAVLAGTAALPPAAGAILPGVNGPLVITSGRDDGSTVLSDGRAQIWVLPAPGFGATRVTTLGLSHHRHASWSPDRTKIAYARGPDDGTPFDGPWDIYVHDLSVPGSAPVNITKTFDTSEDRPTWSPDGRRIAYAKQKSVGGAWDVVTRLASGEGGETTVAVDASAGAGASGQFSRPQWSADGGVIYYSRIVAANDYDIYGTFSNGSSSPVGFPIVIGSTNDYQPALSADGTKLCFTRQGANKDVYVAGLFGGAPTPLTTDSTDEYECAWSPDGSRIAFVRGGFAMGQILMRSSDATGDVDSVTDAAGRFDGNPGWTRNPVPRCANRRVSVAFNGFARIELVCTDERDPPRYEDPELDYRIAAGPQNGNLGGINEDHTVVYTPNTGFRGTDSFSYAATDQTTESPLGSITITIDATTPAISDVSVSPRRWRRGTRLPRSSARVGTRIRWRLSEAARVTLTFERARRRGGRTRFVRAGRLTVPNAKAGLNTVRFQGRLNRRKRLRLGRYRVAVDAVDAAGHRAERRLSRTFRIVAR